MASPASATTTPHPSLAGAGAATGRTATRTAITEALEELAECAGSQFDPEVVEAFLRVLERR